MDQMVQKTQLWLNSNYMNKLGYIPVNADGVTGWSTIFALTTALQIELGISTPNGNFGPATRTAFKSLSIKSQPQSGWTEAQIRSLQNQIYILQGALYCKGYNPTGLTGTFGVNTEAAIKQLQTDAGITQTGIVDVVLMRALLSMDAFVKLSYAPELCDDKVRLIQQSLNRKFISNKYFSDDLGLISCDGIYERKTNKALIYALQILEGISVPNGNFGPTTTSLSPTLNIGQTSSYVLLMQQALYCNGKEFEPIGFNPSGDTGYFGTNTQVAVKKFQEFNALSADGIAGKQTWASLLVSTGDPLRKGKACDTSETITNEKAISLKNDGRLYVGRYLTGKYKITPEELEVIYKNGLKVIPIMQVLNDSKDYFDETTGLRDAQNAITVAKFNSFSASTVIYFAVDYDASIYDVTDYLEPYFKQVKKVFDNATVNPNKFRVGIYAPRAICTLMSTKGYCSSSYVSDMSTGFTSNIGHPLPKNWAFDQIYEYPNALGTGNGAIMIDNVITKQGVTEVCNSVENKYSFSKMMKKINNNALLKSLGIELSSLGTLTLRDNSRFRIWVDAGTKHTFGDEAYSKVIFKDGKYDGVEFNNELNGFKTGLSAEMEAQLSKSFNFLNGCGEVTIKISSSPKSLKIEVESAVDVSDIWPYAITVTFGIEIKSTDRDPLIESKTIYSELKKLAYNTASGLVSIAKEAILVIGLLIGTVVVFFVGKATFAAIIAGEVVTGIIAVLVLGYGILKEVLSDKSNT